MAGVGPRPDLHPMAIMISIFSQMIDLVLDAAGEVLHERLPSWFFHEEPHVGIVGSSMSNLLATNIPEKS